AKTRRVVDAVVPRPEFRLRADGYRAMDFAVDGARSRPAIADAVRRAGRPVRRRGHRRVAAPDGDPIAVGSIGAVRQRDHDSRQPVPPLYVVAGLAPPPGGKRGTT